MNSDKREICESGNGETQVLELPGRFTQALSRSCITKAHGGELTRNTKDPMEAVVFNKKNLSPSLFMVAWY